MLQCLTEIVGVTNSECQCIIAGLTEAEILSLRNSTSGLYMDNLPGGLHLKAISKIDACRNMAQMAITARDGAIKMLGDDLVIALNNRYKKDKKVFIGNIGRMSYAGTLATSRPFQGMQIRPREYNDGVITMTRLQIVLNAAVTLTVRMYRAPIDTVVGVQVASWSVTTAANAYTTVPIGSAPIKMPLVVNGEMVEYYIVYDITEPGGAVQPKDTNIKCSTCGIDGFADYIDVYGVQMNSPNNLSDKITDPYSHGLILDVEIRCDNETLFCREYSHDDAVAVTMAHAVWYKAGELLIEDVLRQPDVSRYTMLENTRLWGKRNHFRAEYDSRVTYLAAVIDVGASNCYVCRETQNQPFHSGIFTTGGGTSYNTSNAYPFK